MVKARQISLDEFSTMMNNDELTNIRQRIYAEITHDDGSKELVYADLTPLMDIFEKDISNPKNSFLLQLGRAFKK